MPCSEVMKLCRSIIVLRSCDFLNPKSMNLYFYIFKDKYIVECLPLFYFSRIVG